MSVHSLCLNSGNIVQKFICKWKWKLVLTMLNAMGTNILAVAELVENSVRMTVIRLMNT